MTIFLVSIWCLAGPFTGTMLKVNLQKQPVFTTVKGQDIFYVKVRDNWFRFPVDECRISWKEQKIEVQE